MKGCELCAGVARLYCESDQACLCWKCDEKVHAANFLVTKHCRALLCQVCQSPTPWKASGPKFGPTVSICQSCFALHQQKKKGETVEGEDRAESQGGNDRGDEFSDGDDNSDDYDDEEDDDDDEEEEEEEEGDGDNQVVPWTVNSHSPPVASSSSSEDEEISSRFCSGSTAVKRTRGGNADVDSDDEIGCSSSHVGSTRSSSNDEGNSMASLRPLKQARIEGDGIEEEGDHDHNHNHHHDHHHCHGHGQEESTRSTTIIDSLNRLQTRIVSSTETASATILRICRLSRERSH